VTTTVKRWLRGERERECFPRTYLVNARGRDADNVPDEPVGRPVLHPVVVCVDGPTELPTPFAVRDVLGGGVNDVQRRRRRRLGRPTGRRRRL
jgi:hypothetical protein